jgi:signal transduction histidine kinase
MTARARIVVIRDPAGDLARLLEARPERPVVDVAHSLFDALEQTLDDPPETLFHDGSLDDPEEVGALRVIRLALPNLRLVLLGPHEREFELSALAERLKAQVLTRPFDRRTVAAALGQSDPGDGRPDPEAFLDLSKGISDEINNPLLFTVGHLQLLEALLDPDRDAEALEQLESARRGLDRISSTMDRIRTIGRARQLRAPTEPVDLLPLIAEPADAGRESSLRVFVPPDLERLFVDGDPQLLQAALRAFLSVGEALCAVAEDVSILVATPGDGARIRIEARGLRLGDWQLPKAFDPYSLQRVLRGTPHGLSLFLAQTVVHAHGGAATARRRPDGTVLLDLLLPRAPA